MTSADECLRDDDLAFAARTAASVPNLDHLMVPGATGAVYYAGLEALATFR